MNNLGELPTELLSLILQQLTTGDLYETVTVNQRFYTLAMPFLWHTPVIKNTQSLISILIHIQISPHSLAQHIRHLHCGSHLPTEFTPMLLALQEAHGLQVFSITESDPEAKYEATAMIDNNVQHLPQHWPGLHSLTLGHLRLSAWTLLGLGRYCYRHLSHLTLTYCLDVHPSLFHLLRDCPLQVLAIYLWTRSEADSWAVHYWDDALTDQHRKDAVRLGQLTDMTLIGFSTRFIGRLLTAAAAAATDVDDGTIPWPHLVAFRFGDYHERDDDNLIMFLRSHPRIHYYGLAPPDPDDVFA